ncbi:ABC transporter permease subunit [Variovorax sp. VNK109]|uniref:branched-chain amino acid ABC transporter ATP-binding protein/permease n=1 Tax=Variovorax sp. VNK109 TaxID=3400919 RepID=UPI003C0357CC
MSTEIRAVRPPSSLRRRQVVVIGSLCVMMALLITTAPTYYVGLMAMAGIHALVCIGLSLVLGTGQVSLGHAAFVGLGAYASAIMARRGVPTALTIPLAMILCMAVAYVLGRITLRLKGHSLPLATLAWGVAIYVCFVASIGITGGASGMSDIPPLSVAGFVFDTRAVTALAWICVLLVFIGYSRIHRGRVGRIAKAIRVHGVMVTAFGADVPGVKMRVFVASAALAALAGGLFAYYMRFLSPSSFAIGASFNYLIMVVLGGVASPVGAILGAVLFVVMEVGAQYLFATMLGVPGQMEAMLFGALLIVLLLRWPGGILSWLKLRETVYGTPRVDAAASAKQVADMRPQIAKIEVDKVTKRFGGLQALKGVTIDVPRARITGLIGPNGAGKSTLFNAVTAVSPATTGEVRINGTPLPARSREVIRTGMARTFQHVQLVGELTVLQNVMIGGYIDGHAGLVAAALGRDRVEEAITAERAREALQQVGLTADADRTVGSLPLGSQRLVEVARALMTRPDVLLLDEPAAGLRAAEKERLVRLLKSLRDERQMAILLVEHDMELVMSCVDHIFVLNYGELLAEGGRRDIQNNPAVIAAYLGSEA